MKRKLIAPLGYVDVFDVHSVKICTIRIISVSAILMPRVEKLEEKNIRETYHMVQYKQEINRLIFPSLRQKNFSAYMRNTERSKSLNIL